MDLSRYLSNRNPLHDVAGDLLVAAVVEAGGARVGVAGQALDVFEGQALLQEVGDGCDAEGMRGEARRQASIPQSPFDHLADVAGVHRAFGQLPGLADGAAEQGRVPVGFLQSGSLEVFKQNLGQVVTDGDLARLAALLVEVEHPLIAGIVKTGAAEFRDGAGAGGRLNKDGDDGAIRGDRPCGKYRAT